MTHRWISKRLAIYSHLQTFLPSFTHNVLAARLANASADISTHPQSSWINSVSMQPAGYPLLKQPIRQNRTKYPPPGIRSPNPNQFNAPVLLDSRGDRIVSLHQAYGSRVQQKRKMCNVSHCGQRRGVFHHSNGAVITVLPNKAIT